ncbi:unnamed protein product, partial [marine sediment metagenome]
MTYDKQPVLVAITGLDVRTGIINQLSVFNIVDAEGDAQVFFLYKCSLEYVLWK